MCGIVNIIDSTVYISDKFKFTEKKKMNGFNTHVADSASCSKQLKFGMDRILSNEISTKKTGKNKL